jgi:exopolyphosphatase/guanosine-5'-triphosphate,3'-diphosphate pyrophosphatase
MTSLSRKAVVAQRSRSSRPEGSGIRKHAIPRDRAHGVPRDDRPVAVIDIGSNSGRVIVYRREAGRHLHVLAGSRASLRLARGLDRAGRIPSEALERAFEALRDFRSIARGSGVERIAAAGTSALREAANGPSFIRRVRRDLGLTIRTVSGLEEARYGFLGAVGGLPVEHGAFFDLGGGSLQVGRFRGRRLLGAVSVPLGALRVSDRFLHSDPPTGGEVRRLREHAREVLVDAGLTALRPDEELVGTGGTLRNLSRVDQRASGYPIPRLHGYVLAQRHLHDIVTGLAGAKQKKRARVTGLNGDRRDTVVGGGLVIEALLEALGADHVLVSAEGVREGVARSLTGQELETTEAVRRGSLTAFASRFVGWSEERARRREAVAAALHGALDRGAARETGEALRDSARILDVGRTVDFFDRHEHVADLLLATDLGGFSHRRVALLSAVVRQAGDEDARPRSLAPLVTRKDRPAVRRAAVLLALADEITERCTPGSRPAVEVRARAGEAVVRVPALASWGVRGLAERFEAAFGRRLRVVPGAGPRGRSQVSSRAARGKT